MNKKSRDKKSAPSELLINYDTSALDKTIEEYKINMHEWFMRVQNEIVAKQLKTIK